MALSHAQQNWCPPSVRKSARKHRSAVDADSNKKRSRLGNRVKRKLYTHPHAHRLFPGEYEALCRKADSLNR